jgi:hypothetical protein
MKVTLKTGIIFALIWIVFTFTFHLIFPKTTELTTVVSMFVNMFLLLSGISFGLYFHKKKEEGSKEDKKKKAANEGNALSDIKAAMSVGVPYAVIVSVFMFFYYNNINPGIIEDLKKPHIEKLKKETSSLKNIAKLKKSNLELETKTKEEIYKSGLNTIDAIYNAKFTATLSILGMIFLSTIYSILVTVIFRKTIFRS